MYQIIFRNSWLAALFLEVKKMTNKEAIARLKEFAKDNCFRSCGCAINVEWCDFCNDREMFNKAIEALEKKVRTSDKIENKR